MDAKPAPARGQGILTTDRELAIQFWDAWLARVTGIAPEAARGQPITRIIPDLEARGLLTRLRRVLEHGTVEVLAPAFHGYFLACPPEHPAPGVERMAQRTTIAPLRDGAQIAAETERLSRLVNDINTSMSGQTTATTQVIAAVDSIRRQTGEVSKAAAEQSLALRSITERSVSIAQEIGRVSLGTRQHAAAASDLLAVMADIRQITERYLAGVQAAQISTAELGRQTSTLGELGERLGGAGSRVNGR